MYELELPGVINLHPTFHVSQLKKYTTSLHYPGHSTKPATTGVAKGHKKERIVEVVDQWTRMGSKEYRVRWEGGGEGWVPTRNLEYTHEEILNYQKAQITDQQSETEEEEEGSKEAAEEEEELSDKRTKSKKTTLQKELKALASIREDRGEVVLRPNERNSNICPTRTDIAREGQFICHSHGEDSMRTGHIP